MCQLSSNQSKNPDSDPSQGTSLLSILTSVQTSQFWSIQITSVLTLLTEVHLTRLKAIQNHPTVHSSRIHLSLPVCAPSHPSSHQNPSRSKITSVASNLLHIFRSRPYLHLSIPKLPDSHCSHSLNWWDAHIRFPFPTVPPSTDPLGRACGQQRCGGGPLRWPRAPERPRAAARSVRTRRRK